MDVRWGTPVTLVGDTAEEVAEASASSSASASIAASLVDRTGRQVVAIHDDWGEAPEHDTLAVARS